MGGMRVWAALVVAMAALGGCAQVARTADERACAHAASTPEALKAKINRCTAVIQATREPSARVTALVERGAAYRQNQDDDDALRDFNAALAADPRQLRALDGRGNVYFDQGDLARARADFDAAIRLNPGEAVAYDSRGAIEREQGDLASSLRDHNRAIELSPRDAYGWANRGFLFLSKRQWGLALADFADALRLDPDLAFAMDGVGQAELGRGEARRATAAFNRSASAYFNDADYTDALAEDDKALEGAPDDAWGLNNRCWTRAVAKLDLQDALADCQHALQVRPGNANTMDSEAFVHFRMGDLKAALAGYNDALKADPTLAPSRFMRGVVELRLGDRPHGQADIAAAEQADGSVASEFAGYGVTP